MTPARPALFSEAAAPGPPVSTWFNDGFWTAGAALVVVGGVVLRWYHLGWQSLWYDEGYSAWLASSSPGEIVRAVRVDTAPPLYYLLLHGWRSVAGHSEAGMRALSALCGTAALGAAVLVAWQLFQRPAARAVAVVAVAVSSMQVGYAHEVRFYEMMGLAGVVDFYLVLRMCEAEAGSFGLIAAAAGSIAVSLWLNNLLAVDIGFLALAWWVAPGRRPLRGRAIDLAIVLIAAGLVYAPWAAEGLGQAATIGARFWIAPPTGHDLLRMFAQTAGADHAGEHLLGRPVFNGLVIVAAMLIAAAAVLGNMRRAAAALTIYGVLPILFLFGLSRVSRPLFIDRAFIVSSLIVPMLLAVPIESVPAMLRGRAPLAWRVSAGFVIGLVLLASLKSSLSERRGVVYHREAWREVSRYAGESVGQGGLLVFDSNEGELLFDYYFRHGDYTPLPWITGTPADFFAADPPRAMQRVENDAELNPLRVLLTEHAGEPVTLVSAHRRQLSGQGDPTLQLLQQQRRKLEQRSFGDITVYQFAPRSIPATP